MIHRCHLARNRHPMLHPENLQPVHQKVKHQLALLQGVDHERLHPSIILLALARWPAVLIETSSSSTAFSTSGGARKNCKK